MRTTLKTCCTLAGVGAVYALTYAAVYASLWLPTAHGVTLGWDMLTSYWGDIAFQARWVGAGHIPLWNPFDRLGYPAYADPQAGQFYPINWLLYPLGWIFGWMPYWGILLKNWLHLVLASVGMFALLRQRDEVPAGCWAGGFIYALSMPMMDWTASALLWPSSWIPWLWLALDRLFRRPTLRRALATGVVAALAILAGNPPALFYGGLSTIFFCGYLAVEQGRQSGSLGRYAVRLFRSVGVAALTAACVGAPALLPVQELYQHSVRTARNWAFVLGTNLSADQLWGFLLPDLAPRSYLHFGLITLFFAALALYKAPKRVGWAAALTLFGALLALGGHGFALRAVAEVLPPFRLFRAPHRYCVLCAAGLALWAPTGISVLYRLEPRQRRRAAVVLAGLGAAAALASAVVRVGWIVPGKLLPQLRTNPTLLLSMLLAGTCIIVAALIWLQRAPRARLWPAAAVVATALALWLGGWTRTTGGNRFPRPTLSHDTELAEQLLAHQDQRIYDDRFLRYRPGSRLSIRDASGYEGDPLGSIRYDALMRRVRRRPVLLRHLGVALYLRGTPPPLGPRINAPLPTTDFAPVRPKGVYLLRRPAPLVYVASRITWVATPNDALNRWLGGPVGETAVISRTDVRPNSVFAELTERGVERHPARGHYGLRPDRPSPLGSSDGTIGAQKHAPAGTLEFHGPDELVAHVNSPSGGMAVILEAWYPGWDASLDGRSVDIYRVNYLFRGVVVGPGAHTIRLRFRPWRFYASSGLFLFGLAIALGWQSQSIRRLFRRS